MANNVKGWWWGIAYLVSIMLGNIFVILFNLKTVSLTSPDGALTYFSLTFPAGAVWIGLTFSLRDFVQRYWGHAACWFWMIAASLITTLMSLNLALASFCAFIVAEGIDWVIYYYLKISFRKRIFWSNLISCPIDSAVFVTIAFGWVWPAIWGQTVVKFLFSLVALGFVPPGKKSTFQVSGREYK